MLPQLVTEQGYKDFISFHKISTSTYTLIWIYNEMTICLSIIPHGQGFTSDNLKLIQPLHMVVYTGKRWISHSLDFNFISNLCFHYRFHITILKVNPQENSTIPMRVSHSHTDSDLFTRLKKHTTKSYSLHRRKRSPLYLWLTSQLILFSSREDSYTLVTGELHIPIQWLVQFHN